MKRLLVLAVLALVGSTSMLQAQGVKIQSGNHRPKSKSGNEPPPLGPWYNYWPLEAHFQVPAMPEYPFWGAPQTVPVVPPAPYGINPGFGAAGQPGFGPAGMAGQHMAPNYGYGWNPGYQYARPMMPAQQMPPQQAAQTPPAANAQPPVQPQAMGYGYPYAGYPNMGYPYLGYPMANPYMPQR